MTQKTAWIQVVCYLLGYGCCAVPGALFIKKYTYKSGVMLGLGLYALGALLFYPAMLSSGVNIDLVSLCICWQSLFFLRDFQF